MVGLSKLESLDPFKPLSFFFLSQDVCWKGGIYTSLLKAPMRCRALDIESTTSTTVHACIMYPVPDPMASLWSPGPWVEFVALIATWWFLRLRCTNLARGKQIDQVSACRWIMMNSDWIQHHLATVDSQGLKSCSFKSWPFFTCPPSYLPQKPSWVHRPRPVC